MKIEQVNLVYFSPTGTTRKVVTTISEGFRSTSRQEIDLTPAPNRQTPYRLTAEAVTILGTPVYSGRVPAAAAKAIRQLRGEGPAILVVVYGNRKFEDALLELRDLASAAGFVPLAAAAFVGEHSYASDHYPIALGRPDVADLALARKFGAEVQSRIDALTTLKEIPMLVVPGNVPYKQAKSFQGISPASRTETCTLCGTCAEVCPMASISVTDRVKTNADTCIICCACVKNCPSGARELSHPDIDKIAAFLSEKFRQRQEPQWYCLS